MLIKRSTDVLFSFSILFIITMTLLYPMPTSISTTSYTESNYIPFVVINELLTTRSFIENIYNIIGNIVLFMPLGFLLPLKFKWIDKFIKCIVMGLIFSIIIELCQLVLPYRQTDIDDVLLNTLGSGLGYCVFNLCMIIIKNNKFS